MYATPRSACKRRWTNAEKHIELEASSQGQIFTKEEQQPQDEEEYEKGSRAVKSSVIDRFQSNV